MALRVLPPRNRLLWRKCLEFSGRQYSALPMANLHHFHILVLLGIGYHRVGQQDGFAGRMGHYYPVAGFNMLYCLLGCGQLLLIQSSPVLHCYTSFSFIIASQAAASCSLLLMYKFVFGSLHLGMARAHGGTAAHHQDVLLPALSGGLYLPFGVPPLQLLYRGHPVIAWVATPTVLYAYSHASPA